MNLVQKYEYAWSLAKRDLDQMVTEALATKTSLPNNYWQAEHAARMKFEAAQRIYPAVIESLRTIARGP